MSLFLSGLLWVSEWQWQFLKIWYHHAVSRKSYIQWALFLLEEVRASLYWLQRGLLWTHSQSCILLSPFLREPVHRCCIRWMNNSQMAASPCHRQLQKMHHIPHFVIFAHPRCIQEGCAPPNPKEGWNCRAIAGYNVPGCICTFRFPVLPLCGSGHKCLPRTVAHTVRRSLQEHRSCCRRDQNQRPPCRCSKRLWNTFWIHSRCRNWWIRHPE